MLIFLILLLAPTPAEPLTLDEWHVIHVDGHPAGYSHLSARELPGGGARVRLARRLSVRRLGARIDLETHAAVDEDRLGGVLAFRVRTSGAGSGPTETSGVRDGASFEVTERAAGRAPRRWRAPAPEGLVGSIAARRRLRQHLVRVDAEIDLLIFSTATRAAIPWHARREGDETIALPDGRSVRGIRLAVEEQGVPGTLWVDEEFAPVRSSSQVLGREFLSIRSDRETAHGLDLRSAPEVFAAPLVDAHGPSPVGAARALYRLTLAPNVTSDVLEPAARAAGQSLLDHALARQRQRAELHVLVDHRARSTAGATRSRPLLPGVYLAPSRWIESDDPAIRRAAREASGPEQAPWRRALRLAHWVRRELRTDALDVLFASAAETLAAGRGDCTEHAVLLAALCRAVAIPARISAGLVYRDGAFHGHMWTEVYVRRWRALDATGSDPTPDAARIAIATSALEDGAPGELFARVARAVSGLRIDIVLPREPGTTRKRAR